jgi:hypothetical protein
MAVENIGVLVPTKIPGYADAADIQAALRAYHYGSYSFDTSETNPANLINPSIAYTITNLQTQITGITADYVTSTSTTTLTNKTLTSPVVSGLSLSDSSIIFEGSTANDFETTLTVTDPTADRTITFPDTTGTVALLTQVINNTLTTTTGDIIYASGSNTPARLGIGSEGQVLSVSSGIPAWSTPAAGGGGSASLPDIFLLGGM